MILWFICHLTTAYCGAIYLSNKSIYHPINTRGDVNGENRASKEGLLFEGKSIFFYNSGPTLP